MPDYKGKKLLFIINRASYFLSHRLKLAQGARDLGFEVHVAAEAINAYPQISEMGFITYDLPMSRGGTNVFAEMRAIWTIYRLMKKHQFDLVHAVTLKPVLYASLAGRFMKNTAQVNALTGLGLIFTVDKGLPRILRMLVSPFLKLGLSKVNSRTIFQNRQDMGLFIDKGLVPKENTILIRGSGVDVDVIKYNAEPDNKPPIILFPARLVKTKGVDEFIQAAKNLRKQNIDARFQLAGEIDAQNPTALQEKDIRAWEAENIIEWLGYRSDMPDVFAASNIVCLPSYREGLPKALLEAMATGRAIVTTDTSGCREAVEHDLNGYLVPVYDSEELTQRLQELILNPALRQSFGVAGRKRAEKEFSVTSVVRDTLSVYRDVVSS